MPKWTAFPHTGEFQFTAASLKKLWPRLHAGDAQPLPADKAALEAWALFHNGDFQAATEAGLAAGGAGITAANKATAIYANYLEKKEKTRLELFMEVAQRAQAQAAQEPDNANAWYWQAYALGRYSQGISVAKALAQGLGTKVKDALEKTIQLQPNHADAHIALAAFHAEVIDKVGALIGGMTYGAKRETGLKLYEKALALNPGSPICLVEYGHGLVMLEGEKRAKDARKLFEQAAACEPLDATQSLDVALAKAELDG
jgi:hypothetical protein